MVAHSLLYPQLTCGEVPDSADTCANTYADGRTRVCLDVNIGTNTQVLGNTLHSQSLAGAFHDPIQPRFAGAACSGFLGGTPVLDEVFPYNNVPPDVLRRVTRQPAKSVST